MVNFQLIVSLAVVASVFLILGLLWIMQLRNYRRTLATHQAALSSLRQQIEDAISVRTQTEEKLQKTEELYSAVINSANELIVVIQDRVACLVNPQITPLTGYTAKEITSQPFSHFIDPQDQEIVNAHYKACLEGHSGSNRCELRVLDKHGKSIWCVLNGVKIEWEGRPAILNFLTDTSDRKQLEMDLSMSEDKYHYMVQNTSDVLWHLDTNYCFDYISHPDERVRGFKAEEVIGKPVWSLLKPEGIEYVKQVNEKRLRDEQNGIRTGALLYELELIRKDGSWVWTEISVSPHHDSSGTLIGYHGVTRDISEQKRLRDELKRLATQDHLTGLSNRRHFFQQAALEFKRAILLHHPMAVVVLDVDYLKTINDNYGHPAGDEALQAFARVCSQNCREIDLISRIGGDEFALLMPETNRQQALAVIERIQADLAVYPFSFMSVAPQQEQAQSLACPKSMTLSAGITELSSAQESLDALMKRADRMLYQAKQAGRDCIRMDQT